MAAPPGAACPGACTNLPCGLAGRGGASADGLTESGPDHPGGGATQETAVGGAYARRLPLPADVLLELVGLDSRRPPVRREAPGPCYELRLPPGTRLYETPNCYEYAFVVVQGAVERRQFDHALQRPAMVGFSGRGDLVVPNVFQHGQQESAVTVTWADLLAVPRHVLEEAAGPAQASGPLERLRIAEIARDVKARYRLRDIPEPRRLAQGLAHILELAGEPFACDRNQDAACFALPYASLSDWLALDEPACEAHAGRLSRFGAMSPSVDRIVRVFPHVLRAIAQHDSAAAYDSDRMWGTP